MANNFDSLPQYIDTAGAGSTTNREITGIIVNASADNWEVVLHDASGGNVIYQAKSSLANHRHVMFAPSDLIPVDGVYATTLTNITNVLVYYKK